MKYAAEARIFDNGRIITRVRPAQDGEEDHMKETEKYDIWVDIFEDEQEALDFCRQYLRT